MRNRKTKPTYVSGGRNSKESKAYKESPEYGGLLNLRNEVNSFYHKFESENLYYTNESPTLIYHSRKYDPLRNTVRHNGQLKLFLSELQFLVTYWDSEVIPNPIIVYAGAAHGYHIPILADLFPVIEWHLYDPRKFGITGGGKIKLYEQYFTDEDAEYWKERREKGDDILFISDIRREGYSNEGINPEGLEDSIMEDMQNQMRWVLTIRPQISCLKFRLPYSHLMGESKTMEYLSGDVLFQSFCLHSSTEGRLVVDLPEDDDGEYKLFDYDIVCYEEAMFYHNAVTRISKNYLDPITNMKIMPNKGILNSKFDTQHLLYCLNEYITLITGEVRDDDTRLIEVINLAHKVIETNENYKKMDLGEYHKK